MDTIFGDGGLALTKRTEPCDKCGSAMTLQGAERGFERCACPGCHQVVGIDRDPEVGGRVQLQRGHPWRYSPTAFRTG